MREGSAVRNKTDQGLKDRIQDSLADPFSFFLQPLFEIHYNDSIFLESSRRREWKFREVSAVRNEMDQGERVDSGFIG